MSSDPTIRRLLPHTSQMGTFVLPPQAISQAPREAQKNYVFVDEHNRHKRLKVMRACEGCRRRKIKCDAATTNTWPCAACIRLKLSCVRPNGYEGSTEPHIYESVQPEYEIMGSMQGTRQAMVDQRSSSMTNTSRSGSFDEQRGQYTDISDLYQTVHYTQQAYLPNAPHYTTIPPTTNWDGTTMITPASYSLGQVEANIVTQEPQSVTPPPSYEQPDLSHLLGSLNMSPFGSAPYLTEKLRNRDNVEDHGKGQGEDEDFDRALPPLAAGPGHRVRIPPELMLDDITALRYFSLYFDNVHQYVPVLDKADFYRQWHRDRDGLHPLILESIFAIAGQISEDPAEGQQWLALASRHADSFMNVPKLSTVQALLLLLKARESRPRQGYYYRSWLSISQIVQMAKDLGLEEHGEDHVAGRTCPMEASECILKRQIWHTIFCCELMIGSAQGRYQHTIDVASIDVEFLKPSMFAQEADYNVHRNFTYFVRILHNVSQAGHIYARLRKQPEWILSPEFRQLNPMFQLWMDTLPPEFAIAYPADGSPPWLSSLFTANMHAYYHLSVIILHRPQLTVLDPADNQWKHHMRKAYGSAKAMCKLQEAMLNNFGLTSTLYMLRGVNYSIYCILSSIVLHLVAITCPDPEFSSDAREYLTRHMRVLERSIKAWPMPDMQKQVDSIREAFSADIRKPFVLKPSFPYGSPVAPQLHLGQSFSDPPRSAPPTSAPHAAIGSANNLQASHARYSYPHGATNSAPVSRTSSPGLNGLPLSSSADDTVDRVNVAPINPMAPGTPVIGGWNPSRIFDHWTYSFGVQESPNGGHNNPTLLQSASMNAANAALLPAEVQQIQQQGQHQRQQQQHSSVSSFSGETDQLRHHSQSTSGMGSPHSSSLQLSDLAVTPLPQQPTFVTPAMWQESVASVYEGGLKRGWDFEDGLMSSAKRR